MVDDFIRESLKKGIVIERNEKGGEKWKDYLMS